MKIINQILTGIAIGLIAASCTAPEDESQYIPQVYKPDCGIIIAVGENAKGDYIEVRMPGYNAQQKDRYKVVDYQDYLLGKEICNFANMQEMPN